MLAAEEDHEEDDSAFVGIGSGAGGAGAGAGGGRSCCSRGWIVVVLIVSRMVLRQDSHKLFFLLDSL